MCLITKAIHIELVNSLFIEALLNALKRFIRQGKVMHIYSDNETNFQRTSNVLKKLNQMLHNKHHQEEINKLLREDYIKWHFIPLYASPFQRHLGGLSQIR